LNIIYYDYPITSKDKKDNSGDIEYVKFKIKFLNPYFSYFLTLVVPQYKEYSPKKISS